MNKFWTTKFIKDKAYELGFAGCGISRATFLAEEAIHLEKWLNSGRHGQMAYMAHYVDERLDPRQLVDNARSVVSLLYNYFTLEQQQDPEAPKISRYAYGQDYHFIIKKKLKTLLHSIREQVGMVNGRVFVDSAPVLERAWAARSGLGWIGKNTNLIIPKSGSYFFIAELILDLELIYDTPIAPLCGKCRRCLDACPTNAIVAPYIVDANKCISYLTIELKSNIPVDMTGMLQNWMFGCDICQDVCPWNRFAQPHQEKNFFPPYDLMRMTKQDWQKITREKFSDLFQNSSVKRIKFEGLKRNIEFLTK